MEILRNMFSRQAIQMTWDFAEGNLFAESSGSLAKMTSAVAGALEATPCPRPRAGGSGASSGSLIEGALISTDPPYYDNIAYADLSDFFYVWLRRSLRDVYPELLGTMLVPKAEELIANPYRHGGPTGARQFFEDGFREVFSRFRSTASPEFPIAVYYAFKQSESDDRGDASTGWETLLEGMVQTGWEITSTWPLRTESKGRMRDIGSNALASSIVLTLRPRPDGADYRPSRVHLRTQSELPDALRKLQQGQVAPVDLPQAAIGPGMAVFSRYSAVLEPDGAKMAVRSALARINEILDQVLNDQEGDFDSASRFAIAWYRQHGYGAGKFGDGLLGARPQHQRRHP